MEPFGYYGLFIVVDYNVASDALDFAQYPHIPKLVFDSSGSMNGVGVSIGTSYTVSDSFDQPFKSNQLFVQSGFTVSQLFGVGHWFGTPSDFEKNVER